ncbi:MAG: LysR family transcriptional regulator [Pseudomonadota bacterium]
MHAAVLRYFIEVARRGSIRKAADILHVASSAVNRQIINLEDEMGTPLFYRVPGGVRLTAAGELLLSHANSTLLDFERVRDEVEDLKGLKTGNIRIIAIDSLMVDVLPEAVAAFHEAYPQVTYSVVALGPADVTKELASGNADIAISFVPSRQTVVHTVKEIATPMGVVMRPDHPLADRGSLSVPDCLDYPIFMQPDILPLSPVLEAELRAARTRVRPKMISNSMDLHKRLIKQGVGIAFFTPVAFLREVANRELIHVPLMEPHLANLRMGIIIPSQRQLSPMTMTMVAHLERSLIGIESQLG